MEGFEKDQLKTENSETEINLQLIFDVIIRNKKLVLIFTAFTMILGTVYAKLKPLVWEGEFKIVLAKENSKLSRASQFLNQNPNLSRFIQSTGALDSRTLKTEIEILQSPLVLMPVFDYFKEFKTTQGINLEKLTFSAWSKGKISFDLKQGTNVLTVKFRDNQKNFIIPILDKISTAYQNYSGKDRTREIQLGISYLDKQIGKYKEKAELSQINLIKFSKKNNLIPLNESNDSDPTKGSLYLEIDALNKEIAILETKFTEKDKFLKRKKEKRSQLLKKIQSEDILIQYNTLLKKASRDEKTIRGLENERRFLALEKVKKEDPWELITNPTLYPKPINKLPKLLIFGLISGLVGGSCIALIKDLRENLIFDVQKINKIIKRELMFTFSSSNKNSWSEYINLFSKSDYFTNNKTNLFLIPVGNLDKKNLEEVTTAFKEVFSSNRITISNNLMEIKESQIVFLLASKGSISEIELEDLIRKLNVAKSKYCGWFLIENSFLL